MAFLSVPRTDDTLAWLVFHACMADLPQLMVASCCSLSGKCATCNPISEPDLAAALVDTIADSSKENALWNLGGPDDGLSMRQQGELVADVLGKPSKLFGVPIGIFDVIINTLQFLGTCTFDLTQTDSACCHLHLACHVVCSRHVQVAAA